MNLPNLNTPRYELNLPSTGDKIQFRPFLVKEEKILLVAKESGDAKEIADATLQVINNCTFEKLDLETLPLFDIEYLLLKIRSKSVGEKSKIRLIAQDDKVTPVDVEIDLSSIEVSIDKAHTNKIILDGERKLGIVFAYPTYKLASMGLVTDKQDMSKMFDIVISCVDHIYEGDTIFKASEYTREQMVEFLDGLNQKQFEKITHFFETMPSLAHEIEFTNPKTNKVSNVTLKGLDSFF